MAKEFGTFPDLSVDFRLSSRHGVQHIIQAWEVQQGNENQHGSTEFLSSKTIHHTPWKINMEHNHGGLEDQFSFLNGDL